MTKTSTAGSQPREAVTYLISAGQSVATIAAELEVHVSTVYRWRAGTRRPSPANHAALKALVFDLQARELARYAPRAQVTAAYRRIVAALDTDADRAEANELIAKLNADLDRTYGTAPAVRPASVTASIDPFELARGHVQTEIPF